MAERGAVVARRAVATIGGVAAAVVIGLVVLLINIIPSGEKSVSTPTTSSTVSPTTSVSSTASARSTSTPDDPDAAIRALDDVGVDSTIPREALVSYLRNSEFTPYPAVASALLELLSDRGLRQPVSIDVIVWNYEHSPGSPSPRRVQDVNFDVLKTAVVEGFNNRYGEQNTDFESLLRP
jgi:hypothetical protein